MNFANRSGSPGKGQSCCVSYSWCESSNAEQMWHRLMNYDKGNYLMACTATYCKQDVLPATLLTQSGLFAQMMGEKKMRLVEKATKCNLRLMIKTFPLFAGFGWCS